MWYLLRIFRVILRTPYNSSALLFDPGRLAIPQKETLAKHLNLRLWAPVGQPCGQAKCNWGSVCRLGRGKPGREGEKGREQAKRKRKRAKKGPEMRCATKNSERKPGVADKGFTNISPDCDHVIISPISSGAWVEIWYLWSIEICLRRFEDLKIIMRVVWIRRFGRGICGGSPWHSRESLCLQV